MVSATDTSRDDDAQAAESQQSVAAFVTDPRRSLVQIWGQTPRQRLMETLWEYLGQPLMRLTFHNWYPLRRALLRLFGANVHPTARIRPSVKISHPWHLTIGAYTAVGDNAILFCLGPISVGDRCTISQYAHLCAGSHDYRQKHMPLITDSIVVEDDVWIAADVFVGPGVCIGTDTLVGARSTVLHSLPPRSICVGDNAKRIGDRAVRTPQPPASRTSIRSEASTATPPAGPPPA